MSKAPPDFFMLANRKSQEDGWIYGVTYKLDAELELTPEEQHIIDRHGLANNVIFDTENVDYYGSAAIESAGNIGYQEHVTKDVAGDEHLAIFSNVISSFFTSMYHVGATAYNAIQWSFSLTITVQSLIDGTHIESDDYNEILQAESLIRSAVDIIKSHIDALGGFEGQDDLIDPE